MFILVAERENLVSVARLEAKNLTVPDECFARVSGMIANMRFDRSTEPGREVAARFKGGRLITGRECSWSRA